MTARVLALTAFLPNHILQLVLLTFLKVEQYACFFFHRLGWFPIQDPIPTCYCISGPRRIPAVGVTRHTLCAHCRTWVYPYQGDARHHTTMDPASLSPPQHHTRTAHALWMGVRMQFVLFFFSFSTIHMLNFFYIAR